MHSLCCLCVSIHYHGGFVCFVVHTYSEQSKWMECFWENVLVLVCICVRRVRYCIYWTVGRNRHVYVIFCIGCVYECLSQRQSVAVPNARPKRLNWKRIRTHKRKTHNRFNYILSWLLAHCKHTAHRVRLDPIGNNNFSPRFILSVYSSLLHSRFLSIQPKQYTLKTNYPLLYFLVACNNILLYASYLSQHSQQYTKIPRNQYSF